MLFICYDCESTEHIIQFLKSIFFVFTGQESGERKLRMFKGIIQWSFLFERYAQSFAMNIDETLVEAIQSKQCEYK